MWLHSGTAKLAVPSRLRSRLPWTSCRCLMTLAIETSCDDTSVAVLEKGTQNGVQVARLHFHKKITSNSTAFQGIHPLISLQSHQEHLAGLVSQAIKQLSLDKWGQDISVISVTRGPGLRSNLVIGLELAKGLAAAWQKPLVGVHHMQAHALTPRLVHALEAYSPLHEDESCFFNNEAASSSPDFPFLSLLASGGHTLLTHSASLTDHHVLGTTNDIAIGECLDKVARVILPVEVLQTTKSTMYASLLENFAFGDMWREDLRRQAEMKTGEENQRPKENEALEEEGSCWFSDLFSTDAPPPQERRDFSVRTYLKGSMHRYSWYEVPLNHEEAARKSATKWGWGFNPPLTKAAGGTKINSFEMSFSGLLTAVERVAQYGMDPSTKKLNKTERAAADFTIAERKDMAREVMRAAFEHLTSRVLLGLQSINQVSTARPAVVVAGGVAANSFLRHILAITLHAKGFDDVDLHFPAPEFCTDNAAMIGWTGLEMFEAGHTDTLSIRAIRKWPLDRLLDAPDDG